MGDLPQTALATSGERTREGVKAYYEAAQAQSSSVMKQTLLSDSFADLCDCHSMIDDIDTWISCLRHRREHVVMQLSKIEYEQAMVAIMRGDYRGAFARLRLTLELFSIAIYGSANRVDLEDWLGGVQDTSWARLTDENSGIFAVRFCRSFCPDLLEDIKHFRAIAAALYRECSEFVHGNPTAGHAVPPVLSFSAELVKLWIEKARSVSLLLAFLFAMRYIDEFDDGERGYISESLSDRIGHLEAVRRRLSAEGGGQ